ncbi:hypothetical protein [Bradyrhizobium sp.]|uniref:hypothetical protein n=1 Tax=Bradyrhizobium sp. TaxID=376 RepID=UPI001DE67DB4|nr:hypothetical protein [Bradyrhizobium sp.]MBV8701176.1 hypothetical protein [Bradyrhizobium sp.]MBV9982115.1 hypothetical protein [Bradyrhizobium sp.]
MICPYCQSDTGEEALVCSACGRDIAIPASLIAERDALLRKREMIRDELHKAEAKIAMLRSQTKFR